jgi:hypothetical protein
MRLILARYVPSTRFVVWSRTELYEIARWPRSGTSSSAMSNFSGFGGTNRDLRVNGVSFDIGQRNSTYDLSGKRDNRSRNLSRSVESKEIEQATACMAIPVATCKKLH